MTASSWSPSLPGRLRRLAALALAPWLVAGGCSSPHIAALYRDAAEREVRNPVVVVHGILGARLVQRGTGRTVWGAFDSESVDPDSAEGARAIALELQPPPDAFTHDPETADVYAAGPLERLELSLLFSVVSVEVYANILRTLGVGGYLDPVVDYPDAPRYGEDHFTCFSFFYDWRRDNVENAIRFGRFLAETRRGVEETARKRIGRMRASGDAAEREQAAALAAWLERGIRFDVVAHSMGGLVARYYLRYGGRDRPEDGSVPAVTWAGAEDIDRLVVVGTPNLGAMDALQNLVRGYRPAILLPRFSPALLGTMPSIYQLLPRVRHRLVEDADGRDADLDFMDPAVWTENGWGLADPESDEVLAWLEPDLGVEQRRAKARRYLAWCLERARWFHAALDARPGSPCPAEVYSFASDTEETLARCRLESREGRVVPTFASDSLYLAGDGTVPRYSAVGDERQGRRAVSWLESPVAWTHVTFLADDHVGLTRNPYFTNNLLFLLLEMRPREER